MERTTNTSLFSNIKDSSEMGTADDYSLVRKIATACYGRQARIELVTRTNNPVYRMRFGDASKILKFSNREQAIRKELMLIELLRKHDVPVPVIEHADRDGSLTGKPFFIMESAGDHTVMQHLKSPALSRGLLRKMGTLLATIHTITFPTAGDIQHDRIVPQDPRAFLGELYLAAERLLKQGLLEPVEVSLFKSLKMPQTDGVSLCHSDYHTVQCVVKNGEITAVVDWESAWSGNALIDLAITHAYLDYYCPMELTRCFFDGYTLIQALPNDYDLCYLPVRIAHVVGLLRVWERQGTEAWKSAVERKKVDRAIALYRAYCCKWNSAVHP